MIWTTGFCLPTRPTSRTSLLLPGTQLPWTTCFPKAPCSFIPLCLGHVIAFAWKALPFFDFPVWTLTSFLRSYVFSGLCFAGEFPDSRRPDCIGYPSFPSCNRSVQKRVHENHSSLFCIRWRPLREGICLVHLCIFCASSVPASVSAQYYVSSESTLRMRYLMFREDKWGSDTAMARTHMLPTLSPLLSRWHQAALWNTSYTCVGEHSDIGCKQIDF